MKVLLHANAPHVATGYGVQAALLVERLQAEGHDIAVSCTYGQQGAMGTWRGTVPLYPVGYEVNGNDVLHNHAMHHFGGDDGWIVTLLDVWCLINPLLADFNIAAWCPVDHFPLPPKVLDFFDRTGARPIAMSRFGERLLFAAGLDPLYVPLAVDTAVMKPTMAIETASRGLVDARTMFDIPQDAFCVGMVAMNKGWARDRKGFNEALRAFALFHQRHPNAVLYMHAEKYGGAEGINLVELAVHAGIPDHAIRWADQYAYRLGMPPELMAAAYTAMDVLLAPSHGEGFCVPLIEAQACGTPVIASDFSSQTELVGAGWLVGGQPEWDPAQHASYICPSIGEVVERLEEAYNADLMAMQTDAREFALAYDADVVFDQFWRPVIAELDKADGPLPVKDPIPTGPGAVAIIVPAMRRPQNAERLVRSARLTAPEANVYFVCDPDDEEEKTAAYDAGATVVDCPLGETYAIKANFALDRTEEPWIFLCGDDVEFHTDWLEQARKLSDRFDVIGTNDSADAPKNPDVAAGRHSDHCLFRRSYVAEHGASLDGPGTLASEAYQHWFTDKEQVELAKARGVFSPCLDAVVVHHHPGYEGKPRDETYMRAIAHAEADERTFRSRLPLIAMQRQR